MVNKTKKRKKSKKSVKSKSKKKATKKISKSLKKKSLKTKSKNVRNKNNGGKMSAEAMKVYSVLDTSHLKFKFPFKAKYGNYINGKFVEPKSVSILIILLLFQMRKSVLLHDQMKKT